MSAPGDRARVPFALAGVVLLVGSATFTATLATRVPAQDDPATERAIERTTAATITALRAATTRAAGRAARRPVTAPANTSAGHVLNDSTPFRDYLRVRLYLAARAHLRQVGQQVGGVRTTAALPPVPNASALRRAKRRVRVERAGPNGTAMRVHVANVTVVARRNGRVVERVHLSPSFVVETPVLALHDRVRRFERRLAAPATEPGLNRRLTARLYALAWARGYAQYGGTPISNVIANRHVELAANDALLATQQAVFGRADPAGRRGLAAAFERVAFTDILTAAGAPPERTDAILRAAERIAPDERVGVDPVGAWESGAPSPDGEMTVGVNRSADVGLVLLVETNLTDVLRSVYSARVRVAGDAERVEREQTGSRRPAGDWTLTDERRRTETRVTARVDPRPDDPPGWHVLRAYGRRVVRKVTTVRTWRRDGDTRTTRSTRTSTYRVTVSLLGRHAPSDDAPRRGIATVHERGAGPLDGPNLAGIESRAVERLVSINGGADALARHAVDGSLATDPRAVPGERPDRLRHWVVRDLVALRDRVRNVTVEVRRGAVGTHSVNPPAELAEKLRRRRAGLLDAPATYGSVAGKARIAAQAAYLDRVIARLEQRAVRHRQARDGLRRALRDRGLSLDGIERSLRARRAAADEYRNNTDTLALAIDGAPPYLTLGATSRERAGIAGDGRVRPLAARNLNVFATPYGDAADTVIEGLFDTRRVRLRTAARTLRAASHVKGSRNRTLRRRRAELRRDVRRSVAAVRNRLRRTLRREGVGASAGERRAILTAGLSRWNTTAGRALALANGSAGRAVAAAAADRDERFASPLARTRLRMRLRVAVDRALASPGGRPPQRSANRTTRISKAFLTDVLEYEFERAGEAVRRRVLGETLGVLPAGLPVAPTPGYWYATTNVWHVQVRGGYERFTVRARRGRPTMAGAALPYTRAGRAVRLDVDGDGRVEVLGHGERISFRAETAVVVVVPPGGRGVGDTDGDADERSPGWEN